MYKATRATSHRTGKYAGVVARDKGRQKRGTKKNVSISKSLITQDNSAKSSIKDENEHDITKNVINKFDMDKTRSILETINSTIRTAYPCNQDTNAEIIEDKSLVSPTYLYHFESAQSVSASVQVKIEKIYNIEQFKIDETPVAVPVHGPSTPHRIKMPLEDLDEKATITTKEKQSVMTLLNPLVIKKHAPRGRKKAVSNQSVNHRLPKPLCSETNHSITEYFPVRRSVRKCKKAVLEEKQRDIENKVICQIEEGLEIRHFPGKGRGIITTREFTKGEFVVEYIGELIDLATARKREDTYAQDQNTGCYMYYFQHRNQQYCVDATKETYKLGRLVNHSRTGNLIARVIEVNSTPHLVLTAKEDIPIGVEIAYDYGDRSRESIRHHPWLAL